MIFSRILLSVSVLAAVAAPAAGQEIRFDPRPDWPAERRFDAVLATGDYRIIRSDTVIGRSAVIHSGILVLDADVRIEGTVTGDVAAVGGDLFLRPSARIGGDVLVLGGGFYSSRQADVEGEVLYRPNDLYAVTETEYGVRIHPVREIPEPLTLHGLSGILFPTYQRVDGWTLGLGATARHVAGGWQPSLEGRIRLKTGPGRLEGTLRQTWYPTGSLRFGAEGERLTRTNEAWVRGDVANTLSFFFAGDDFRHYYEADRVAVFLRGTETARWSPIVEFEWERARSLSASNRFILFADDDTRPNPAIDEGEIVSATIGASFRRRTARTALFASARLEAADSSAAGDHSFVMAEADVRWKGPGLAAHEVELAAMLRGDVSGTLPRQRWSAVGGRATLPTVALLAERGSRLAYAHASYLIPLESLRLGLLGPPFLFVRAATGSGWSPGEAVTFETNLISGIRLSFLEVAVALAPADSDVDPLVYAILRFPGDL